MAHASTGHFAMGRAIVRRLRFLFFVSLFVCDAGSQTQVSFMQGMCFAAEPDPWPKWKFFHHYTFRGYRIAEVVKYIPNSYSPMGLFCIPECGPRDLKAPLGFLGGSRALYGVVLSLLSTTRIKKIALSGMVST